MCLLQGRTVTPEMAGVCNKCALYLNTCMPVVDHGFLFGECDCDYCSECVVYDDCWVLGKEMKAYDNN